MGYFEEHPEKVQDVPGGKLCQVFGDAEGASCSVALVKYEEGGQGISHYHNTITEVYIFAEGTGKIIINGIEQAVYPKDIYVVTPNNTHFVQAESPLSFMCVCTPPWLPEREVENDMIDSSKGDIKKTIGKEILFENNEVCINLKKIQSTEIHFDGDKRHVIYLLSGLGVICSNDMATEIKIGEAIEVTNKKCTLKAKDEIEYVEVISK